MKETHCVVMVEQELASMSQIYLSHPVWARRISVLIGSPLRLADLRRARAANAIACFIHTDRGADPDAAVSCAVYVSVKWATVDFVKNFHFTVYSAGRFFPFDIMLLFMFIILCCYCFCRISTQSCVPGQSRTTLLRASCMSRS